MLAPGLSCPTWHDVGCARCADAESGLALTLSRAAPPACSSYALPLASGETRHGQKENTIKHKKCKFLCYALSWHSTAGRRGHDRAAPASSPASRTRSPRATGAVAAPIRRHGGWHGPGGSHTRRGGVEAQAGAGEPATRTRPHSGRIPWPPDRLWAPFSCVWPRACGDESRPY